MERGTILLGEDVPDNDANITTRIDENCLDPLENQSVPHINQKVDSDTILSDLLGSLTCTDDGLEWIFADVQVESQTKERFNQFCKTNSLENQNSNKSFLGVALLSSFSFYDVIDCVFGGKIVSGNIKMSIFLQ